MGTHPIFESDFDCLQTTMTNDIVDVKSLPIYDDESKLARQRCHQPEIVNIYEQAARARHRFVDGPIRCAKAHLKKTATRSYNHLASTTGLCQLSSLTIGALAGTALARRALPYAPKKTFSRPYIGAHRPLACSVPWAISCYWFETPALITQYSWCAVKTTISWTLWGMWQPIYWLIIYPPCALVYYTCQAFYTALVFGGGAIYNATTASNDEVKADVALVETTAEAIKEEATEEEVLNKSSAEAELKELKRHANVETVIRIEQNAVDSKLEPIEADPGQANSDDQELYERGR